MSKAMKIIGIISMSVLVGLVIFMGVMWGITQSELDRYRQELNYNYLNNFYSLTDSVNNIETNLSKLSVSTDEEMQERYLTEVVSLCQSAQNNLSSLPLEHHSINETTKFINQLGGYSFTLHQNILNGEELTLDDKDQIDQLHQSASEVKFELNRLANLINSGYSIIDNIKDPNVEVNDFSQQWSGVYDDTIEYPTLIYDGPFSDSTQNKEVKGLKDINVTQTEAELLMQKWFTDWQISPSGESKGGDFDTWNFMLEKEGKNGYAQITQKGGMLLQLGTDVNAGDKNKQLEECELLPENFAKKVGIEDVKVVWSTECEGFVYCNLCYVKDGVIIYPDMIKVKVSQDTGEILGYEARSYAFNHVERTNLTPKISKKNAQEKVDEYLSILTEKLVVVPNEYVGESLAWEFKCLKEGSVYYVYIDALTGKDLNIMKVIETDDGELLM